MSGDMIVTGVVAGFVLVRAIRVPWGMMAGVLGAGVVALALWLPGAMTQVFAAQGFGGPGFGGPPWWFGPAAAVLWGAPLWGGYCAGLLARDVLRP